VKDTQSQIELDLGKGTQRFQAGFDTSNGNCTLSRINDDGKRVVMGTQPTRMTKPGKYHVRLANVDCRLTLWVDDKVIDFADKADYPLERTTTFAKDDTYKQGWTKENDIDKPARIGIKGSAKISDISLWRDVLYTGPMNASGEGVSLVTYYVQPGHYLCMGDNSSSSSDGRSWGLVPERLMLGRAVMVYYPFSRMGLIR
jgi:signal peptidase I